MNRRDLFKGLTGAALGAGVTIVTPEKIMPFKPYWTWVGYPKDVKRGPYDTDDAYYDQLLDEMMGEEWS